MSIFDKREQAAEGLFAREEELNFRARARRNSLLGAWAAEKLGLTGSEAATYAQGLVVADVEDTGDHDVFRKLRRDFDIAAVQISDHQLRRTIEEFMTRAAAEAKAERARS
jgi:hypothetical protein